MSQRKDIRHAIRDLLDAVPSLSGKVIASRTYQVDAERAGALPCVLVYTERDPGELLDGYRYVRNLAVRIIVIVRATVDADDQLDDLCEAIEVALEQAMNGASSPLSTIASLVDQCIYQDTALTYTGDEGRADLVHAEMTFSVRYYHDPAQDFPAFLTAEVGFDMAGPRNDPQLPAHPDGQIDATATITLPQ